MKELTQRGLKIATAEGCTGGYISKRITEVPGSSAVLDGGVVSYSNEIKEKLLGVSHGTLVQHGAVSRETALEMARASAASAAQTYRGLHHWHRRPRRRYGGKAGGPCLSLRLQPLAGRGV